MVTGLQRAQYEEKKIDFNLYVKKWHSPKNYFFLMVRGYLFSLSFLVFTAFQCLKR